MSAFPSGTSMFLMDSTTAKLVAMGYGSFLASILWVDGIFEYVDEQLDGTHRDHPVERMSMVVAFDPDWEEPYHFAGLTLENDAGVPLPEAIRILRQGVVRFPDSWKLRLYLGMDLLARGDTGEAAIVMSGLASMRGEVPSYIREFAITYVGRHRGRLGAVQDILLGFQVVEDPVGRMGFVRKLEQILDSSGVDGAHDSAYAVERAFHAGEPGELERWGGWLARVVGATAPGSESSRSR